MNQIISKVQHLQLPQPALLQPQPHQQQQWYFTNKLNDLDKQTFTRQQQLLQPPPPQQLLQLPPPQQQLLLLLLQQQYFLHPVRQP